MGVRAAGASVVLASVTGTIGIIIGVADKSMGVAGATLLVMGTSGFMASR